MDGLLLDSTDAVSLDIVFSLWVVQLCSWILWISALVVVVVDDLRHCDYHDCHRCCSLDSLFLWKSGKRIYLKITIKRKVFS